MVERSCCAWRSLSFRSAEGSTYTGSSRRAFAASVSEPRSADAVAGAASDRSRVSSRIRLMPAFAYPARAVSITTKTGKALVNQGKGDRMLWLILGIVLLVIAIAGGAIIHPVLFALAIVALAVFFFGR